MAKKNSQKTSTKESYKWLIEQAEEFSKVGLNRNAAGMREAALLLGIGTADDRKALLDDYYFIIKDYGIFDTHIKNLYACEESFKHIEYLLKNKLIDLEAVNKYIRNHSVPFYASTCAKNDDGEYIYPDKSKRVFKCRQKQYEFHKRLFPYFLEETKRKSRYLYFQSYMVNAYLKKSHPGELERAIDYLSNYMREKEDVSFSIISFFKYKKRSKRNSGVSDEQWHITLKQLLKSRKPLVKLLAKYGLLTMQMDSYSELSEEKQSAFLNDSKNFIEEWCKFPAKNSYSSRKKGPIVSYFQKFIDKRLGKQKVLLYKRFVKCCVGTINTDSIDIDFVNYSKFPLTFSSAKLKQDFTQSNFAGGSKIFAGGTKDKDYIWNSRYIWEISKSGKVSLKFSLEKPEYILKVQWDGKYLWVFSDHRTKAISTVRVFDGSWKKVGTLENKDLPVHSSSLKIALLETGHACVVGRVKPHNRVWLMSIKVQGDKLVYKDFFHAKKLLTEKDKKDSVDNAFIPDWIHFLPADEPGKSVVLIGGRVVIAGKLTRDLKYPLVFNSKTLKVSILPWPLKDKPLFSEGQKLYRTIYDAKEDHVLGKQIFSVTTEDKNPDFFIGSYSKNILRHKDNLNFISDKWFRINLKTGKSDEMILSRMPWYLASMTYGSSKVHGILAISKSGICYKVSLLD